MNWDAIGAIAELLGSVAVVATLLMILVQLRQSASAVRNSAIQSALNSNIDILGSLISDPELFAIYYRGIRDTNSLSKEDYARFEILMLNMFRMADMQYRQHRHGGGDEEYWDSLRSALEQSLKMPGAHASWQRQKSVLTKGFVQEVEGWSVAPNKAVEWDTIDPTV